MQSMKLLYKNIIVIFKIQVQIRIFLLLKNKAYLLTYLVRREPPPRSMLVKGEAVTAVAAKQRKEKKAQKRPRSVDIRCRCCCVVAAQIIWQHCTKST